MQTLLPSMVEVRQWAADQVRPRTVNRLASPRALLGAIRQETDPAAKAELANAFLTRMEPANKRVAHRYCQSLMVDPSAWLPGIDRCVRIAAHGVIVDYATGRLLTVEPWCDLLTMRARDTVATFVNSAAGRCRFCGREPTDQEIVDALYRHRKSSRIDPSQVGTVWIKDLTPPDHPPRHSPCRRPRCRQSW